MEKFFIITDECKYKRDYIDYKKNTKEVNEIIKEFFNENGIETSKYYVTDKQLYIIPSNKDIEKFDKQLNKPIQQGLRGFKKNGKINKSFIKTLKEKGVRVLSMPSLWMYLNGFYGNMRTTTCMVGNTMYLKISLESSKDIKEKGFNEIKASEYYLAIGN